MQGYYFKCSTSEMLKLTPEDQAKYMLDLYREEIVLVDEVRAALGLSGDAETIAELKNLRNIKTNNNKEALKKSTDNKSSEENNSTEELNNKETEGKEE